MDGSCTPVPMMAHLPPAALQLRSCLPFVEHWTLQTAVAFLRLAAGSGASSWLTLQTYDSLLGSGASSWLILQTYDSLPGSGASSWLTLQPHGSLPAESAYLLGCLIHSCPRLVMPYVWPILKALVAKLRMASFGVMMPQATAITAPDASKGPLHGKPCTPQLWTAQPWQGLAVELCACSMHRHQQGSLQGHACIRVWHAYKPAGPAGCVPALHVYTLQGHGKPCRAQLWAMRWRACSMQSTGSCEAGLLGHAYTRVCHAIKPAGPAGCVPASHVCTSQLHVCSACVRAV